MCIHYNISHHAIFINTYNINADIYIYIYIYMRTVNCLPPVCSPICLLQPYFLVP